MANACTQKDASEKRHHLEQEQIKMQKELLELELKYGACQVNLPKDDDKQRAAEKSQEKQQEPEQVKVET